MIAELTTLKLPAIIVIQTITSKNMREVINISLPTPMVKTVKTAVKNGAFSSTSEFFRHLLREWQEEQVLNEVNKSRAEISAGKGKILKSFKDLK
jgi:Arc/MetJ-type ribon-helix-helix transcriptional regulator